MLRRHSEADKLKSHPGQVNIKIGVIALLALAVLPSVVLFYMIWRYDRKEKEPFGLLAKLFVFGLLTIGPAIVVGTFLTDLFEEDAGTLPYLIFDNFIATALIEEGGKYFVLKKATWKHPAFNYTFDAVVYAVTVSLGFATLENIIYVMGDTLSTAIVRALLSVPGHVMYAIFMGYYYGKAKLGAARKRNLVKALLVPTLLHGFYDFCLVTDSDIFILYFIAFELVLTAAAIRTVRKLSKGDREIERQGE